MTELQAQETQPLELGPRLIAGFGEAYDYLLASGLDPYVAVRAANKAHRRSSMLQEVHRTLGLLAQYVEGDFLRNQAIDAQNKLFQTLL
jgi:hypothetical protein